MSAVQFKASNDTLQPERFVLSIIARLFTQYFLASYNPYINHALESVAFRDEGPTSPGLRADFWEASPSSLTPAIESALRNI